MVGRLESARIAQAVGPRFAHIRLGKVGPRIDRSSGRLDHSVPIGIVESRLLPVSAWEPPQEMVGAAVLPGDEYDVFNTRCLRRR